MDERDVILRFLKMDDENFDTIYEAYCQYGTNFIGGLLTTVHIIRRMKKEGYLNG